MIMSGILGLFLQEEVGTHKNISDLPPMPLF